MIAVAGAVGVTVVLAAILDAISERGAVLRLGAEQDTHLVLGHALGTVAGFTAVVVGGPIGFVVGSILTALHLRALNELTHFFLHRLRSLSRAERAALIAVTLVIRGESLQARMRTHLILHHPNATGIDDPTARQVALAAAASRGATGLLLRLTAGEAWTLHTRPLRALRSGGPDRASAWATLVVRFTATALVWRWCGPGALAGTLLLPTVLWFPLGMAISATIEHNWRASPNQESWATLLERETQRGFRLRTSRGRDRLLSVTAFPYGDLYHYAHSCRPDLPWQRLRAVDRDLRGRLRYQVTCTSLTEQLRTLVRTGDHSGAGRVA
jgi:fatty acid desaturase